MGSTLETEDLVHWVRFKVLKPPIPRRHLPSYLHPLTVTPWALQLFLKKQDWVDTSVLSPSVLRLEPEGDLRRHVSKWFVPRG